MCVYVGKTTLLQKGMVKVVENDPELKKLFGNKSFSWDLSEYPLESLERNMMTNYHRQGAEASLSLRILYESTGKQITYLNFCYELEKVLKGHCELHHLKLDAVLDHIFSLSPKSAPCIVLFTISETQSLLNGDSKYLELIMNTLFAFTRSNTKYILITGNQSCHMSHTIAHQYVFIHS
jgi:hypothetical protein